MLEYCVTSISDWELNFLSAAESMVLPEVGDVQLVIYNLLGQEVRILIQETMDAGFHLVVWDGTDEFGKQVASGIYICMSVTDFTKVQRMMLLK